MTTIGKPKIDERPEQPYMGIRVQTPFKGMGKVADKLFKEMTLWMQGHGAELAAPPFLRFHVIDMEGEMDIESGFPVKAHLPGDARVKPGMIPAGRYASLIYTGSGYSGNKALIEWAKANGIEWDAWDDPKGHAFRCRCETYLTDPRIEHRKTRWEIEVAIRLADH